MLTVMVPVYNEEPVLRKNITGLYKYLLELRIPFEICIINSCSTDRTEDISKSLKRKLKNVRYLNLDLPGKGSKIKHITLETDSDYFAFIDADLPIRLEEFGEIIKAVISDRADIVKGSRYIKGAKSKRPLKRIIASRTYNLLLRFMLGIKSTDAAVGAKAWNRKIKDEVWPKIKDECWFFDTELLYYAHKMGYKVREIPVTYDDLREDSKFNLFRDASGMGKSLLRFWVNEKLRPR